MKRPMKIVAPLTMLCICTILFNSCSSKMESNEQSSSYASSQMASQPSESAPQPSSSASVEQSSSSSSSSNSSMPVASASSSIPIQESTSQSVVVPPQSSSQQVEVKLDVVAPSDGGKYLPQIENEVIQLINEERASLGLSTLKLDSNLRTASRIRSYELNTTGVFDHTRPDGRSWETVLKVDVPIKYSTAGENLCYYEAPPNEEFTAFDWFSEWKNSAAHYENMIRQSFTHVGVGIFKIENSDGTTSTIATTLFCSY